MTRAQRKVSLLGALLALALMLQTGCKTSDGSASAPHAGSLLPPEPAQAVTSTGLSLEEAGQARKLYTAKCARCHKFYEPAAYPDAEWRVWMTKMSKKARLKPDQEQLLSRYLDTFRPGASSGERGAKP